MATTKAALRGLRAASIGTIVFVLLLGLLQLTDNWFAYLTGGESECSTRNGGPFEDSPFGWLLTSLSMLWLIGIIVEIALPRTWRHQDLSSVFGRLVTSLTVWAVVATFVFVLTTICR